MSNVKLQSRHAQRIRVKKNVLLHYRYIEKREETISVKSVKRNSTLLTRHGNRTFYRSNVVLPTHVVVIDLFLYLRVEISPVTGGYLTDKREGRRRLTNDCLRTPNLTALLYSIIKISCTIIN